MHHTAPTSTPASTPARNHGLPYLLFLLGGIVCWAFGLVCSIRVGSLYDYNKETGIKSVRAFTLDEWRVMLGLLVAQFDFGGYLCFVGGLITTTEILEYFYPSAEKESLPGPHKMVIRGRALF